MTNKIINALLESKFPELDIKALLEVVNATPNAETAVEILCGLYEEPVFPILVKTEGRTEFTFISYNKWDNAVICSYVQPLHRSSYFPKGTKKEDITMENFDSLKISGSEGSEYFSIPNGEVKIQTSSKSLQDWFDMKQPIKF